MTNLESSANNLLRQQLREKLTISFEQMKAADLTLHYLNVPFVTPTWTLQNGNWYFSLYPQMAQSAAQNAAARGPSILENEAFVAMRKRLGDHQASSLMFDNLPKTAPQAYAMWVLLSRYAAAGDVWGGVKSGPMLLPPLPKIMENLGPSGKVTWIDAAGIHSKSVCSFPGSDIVGSEPASFAAIAAPAFMVAILLPALSKAREQAHRAGASNDLRQIGLAVQAYSNQFNQQYPPDLGKLATTENLSPSLFVSPSSNTKAPPGLNTPEEQAAWVNANSDFVYLGAGKNNTIPPAQVLAYEKLGIHHGQGTNVLFGDNSVRWLSPYELDLIFKEQKIQPKY